MRVPSLDLLKLITILLYVFICLSKPTEFIKNSISIFCGNDRFCSQSWSVLNQMKIITFEVYCNVFLLFQMVNALLVCIVPSSSRFLLESVIMLMSSSWESSIKFVSNCFILLTERILYNIRGVVHASMKAHQMFTWLFEKEGSKFKNCENLHVL